MTAVGIVGIGNKLDLRGPPEITRSTSSPNPNNCFNGAIRIMDGARFGAHIDEVESPDTPAGPLPTSYSSVGANP